MNLLFPLVGAIAAGAGGTMVVKAIRHRRPDDPRGVATLIAAMMLSAFGLLLIALPLAFEQATPIGLSHEAAR